MPNDGTASALQMRFISRLGDDTVVRNRMDNYVCDIHFYTVKDYLGSALQSAQLKMMRSQGHSSAEPDE